MKADKLHEVLEPVIPNSNGMEYWQIIIFIAIGAIVAYIGSYLKEKGKNNASKEDIKEITENVEAIKHQLNETNRIKSKKYKLKYQACMDALCILDAQLSHVMLSNNDEKIPERDIQPLEIKTMRECHNRLILSIDDQKIIQLFMSIMLGKSENNMKDLDKIRKLIRKELDFGSEIFVDGENTWFAKSGSKTKSS